MAKNKVILGGKTALYVSDRSNRFYFSQLDILDGIVIVHDKTYYFIDARYYHGVKDKLASLGIEPILYNGLDTIKNFVKEKGIVTLYVDYDKVTLSEYYSLKKLFKKILNGTSLIKSKRQVKNDYELDCISKACDITIKAYQDGIKSAREGISELELCDIINGLMLSYGGQELAFDTIVAFGENSAIPHHQTSARTLKKGDVILVDMGCKINGYCSDLTRTAFFGTPSKEFVSDYEKVLNANLLAEEQITANMLSKGADAIARDYLKENGLGEYFTHSLGHGVGIDIHEAPTLSYRSKEILAENVVFTIEPGVYKPNEYGIRIEDTVVIKNGKVKRLYSDDKRLNVISVK